MTANVTETDVYAAVALLEMSNIRQLREKATQTNDDMKKLITQVHDLSEEKNTLYKQLQIRAFSFSSIEGNDKLTSFYAGLPHWVLFIHVFTFTVPFVQPKGRSLSPMDEFFLTLVKMRLNLMHEDLACRFQISLSSVSLAFFISGLI